MSYRRENENLLKLIQDLAAQVKLLQQGNRGTRQNTIRLGNQVIEQNPELTNSLTVTDIVTGETYTLSGGDPDITFSYPDVVDTVNETSPPYYTGKDSTVYQIDLALLVPSASNVTVNVYIGSTTEQVTLAGGDSLISQATSVSAPAGTRIYVETIDVGDSLGEDLSLTVRFN